jgi:hypothetical protein
MAPIISDCTQITVRGNQPSGEFANVFHTIGLGGAPPDPETMAESLIIAYCDTILTVLTAQVVVIDAAYVDLSSPSGVSGVVTPPGGSQTGGAGGFGAPMNTALLITWPAIGSRTQRNGRTYLPGVDEDQVDTAGLITSGYQDDINEQIGLFRDALQAEDMALVVNSKAPGGTYTPRTITGGSVAGRVATQRRRLRR